MSKATGTPIFSGPIGDWDINKVSLCWWSKFYDSVFEHPERPPQHIIEDNKELDRWIEMQYKKNEAERKRKTLSSGGHKSAFAHDEVIVFGE